MTTTPTIWKAKFPVNFGTTAGGQAYPQTIGLANGNFLTVWADDTFGPSAGVDVLGRIYGPTGVEIKSQFQVNDAVKGGNEAVCRLAAMPDGGFVMAYREPAGQGDGGLVVERFNADGVAIAATTLTMAAGSARLDLSVTSSGDYVVAFNVYDGGDFDVHAVVFNRTTNTPGPEHVNTAQNAGGGESDFLQAIDTFANGDIVCLSVDLDGGGAFPDIYSNVEVRVTSATGSPIGSFVELAGTEDHGAVADDVTVLADGRFVGLYHYVEGATALAFRIGTVSGSGLTATVTLGAETVVSAVDPVGASLVALQGGGFFVAWIVDGQLRGTRYDSNGNSVGAQGFLIDAAASGELGQLSLTSDGRILIPFKDASGEISQVILDPRETLIEGDDINNVLTAQTTNSFLFGYGGDDRLLGHSGNDLIRGGLDNDTIDGGGGGDVIYGEEGFDVLRGGSGNDTIDGGSDDDALYGDDGNDELNGGVGSDTLRGGLNNDTYVLNDLHGVAPTRAYDAVIENLNEGIDTVVVTPFAGTQRPTSYTLGANVENLTVVGSLTFNLFGNGLANVLTGNSASNQLNGLVGADRMVGRGGNDIYIVDNTGDVVIEAFSEGTDQVYALVNYTLTAGQYVEVLNTSGSGSTGNINLTGNELAQTIYGNAGANTLTGGGGKDTLQGFGGNDIYIVDSADDVVIEALNGGTDQIYAFATYRLAAGQHIEVMNTGGSASTTAISLTGNELNQTIFGNAGANTLTGGGGKDTLQGFGGADLYIVDSADDVVIEAVGGGTDQIFALASYTLAAGQEIEVLNTAGSGTTANTNLTGNAFNQTVYGNAGSNVLNGGGGNDVLKGFGGADFFLFNTALGAANIDLIQDFSVADDTIQLENAIFTGLAAGTLTAGALAIGTAATQADDRIVYNSTTGALSFDSDGVGGAAAVRFATLSAGLALTEADFQII